MRSRGTSSNPHNRFAPLRIALEPHIEEGDEVPDSIVAQVTAENARSILSHNKSPDVPFDTSINPYRGCEHVMRHIFVFS